MLAAKDFHFDVILCFSSANTSPRVYSLKYQATWWRFPMLVCFVTVMCMYQTFLNFCCQRRFAKATWCRGGRCLKSRKEAETRDTEKEPLKGHKNSINKCISNRQKKLRTPLWDELMVMTIIIIAAFPEARPVFVKEARTLQQLKHLASQHILTCSCTCSSKHCVH